MWQGIDPFWFTLATMVGWLWGSFLNQVVDRTPLRGRNGQGAGREGPPPGLLRPSRSFCLSCGIPIPWYENLPILTYLALKGRCRSCGAAIGRRTLAMEVATPLAFAALHLGAIGFGAGPWVLLWALAGVSWGLVGAMALWERRRPGVLFWAIGAAVGAGGVAWWA